MSKFIDIPVKRIELAPGERVFVDLTLVYGGNILGYGNTFFYIMVYHYVDGELHCYNEDCSIYKYACFIWPKYHDDDGEAILSIIYDILVDPVIEMMSLLIDIEA